MKELKAANETLRREMEQIKGGEGYFVTRIEELEALVERVESDKAEAQRALAEWGERGGEEEAKRRREKLIQADEKERLRGDKERLEGLLVDADHRAADADGLRRRVDDLFGRRGDQRGQLARGERGDVAQRTRRRQTIQ